MKKLLVLTLIVLCSCGEPLKPPALLDPVPFTPDGTLVTLKLNHNFKGVVIRHVTKTDTPAPLPHHVLVISGENRTINILEDAELEILAENGMR